MGTNLKFKYLKTRTLAVRKCDLLTRYLSKFVKPYYHTYIQPATRPTDAIVTSLAVLPLINVGPPDTDPIYEPPCAGLAANR